MTQTPSITPARQQFGSPSALMEGRGAKSCSRLQLSSRSGFVILTNSRQTDKHLRKDLAGEQSGKKRTNAFVLSVDGENCWFLILVLVEDFAKCTKQRICAPKQPHHDLTSTHGSTQQMVYDAADANNHHESLKKTKKKNPKRVRLHRSGLMWPICLVAAETETVC